MIKGVREENWQVCCIEDLLVNITTVMSVTAIISYDVKNHYISKTDWGKLARLSDGVMEEVVVAGTNIHV